MIDGLSLTIDLKDLPALNSRLVAARRRGEDMTVLMERIGFYGENSTKLRFEDEKAPDGSQWQQSARAKAEGGKTLTQSAQLRESISSEAGRFSAVWGTNKIYAAIHQFGGTIRARPGGKLRFEIPGVGLMFANEVTMPARPYIGFNREDELEILDIAADYFGEAIQ